MNRGFLLFFFILVKNSSTTTSKLTESPLRLSKKCLTKSTTESLFGLCSLSKNYVERISGNKNYLHLLTYIVDADYVKKKNMPKKD